MRALSSPGHVEADLLTLSMKGGKGAHAETARPRVAVSTRAIVEVHPCMEGSAG